MKKTFFAALFAALAASITLTFTASADFAKTASYTEGMFTDVPSSEWYAASVKDAYEFGLMNGTGDSLFSPDGTLTAAEGVTVAARIHAALTGASAIEDVSGEWYDKYVAYGKAAGFVREGQFDSYDREIKRFEMAELLSDVCGALPAVNEIALIPDVSSAEPYADKILNLYRAGVLTGNDAYGVFAPFSNLKRSEISAMAVRVADSAARVRKTFEPLPGRVYTDSYALMEVPYGGGRYGIANSWRYDNRFELFNTTGRPSRTLTDSSDQKFSSLIRDFAAEDEGLITLDLICSLGGTDGGAFIAFKSPDGAPLLTITPKNGKLTLCGVGETATEIETTSETALKLVLRTTLDLDRNTAHIIINNTSYAPLSIADLPVSRLELGTSKAGKGYLSLWYAEMNKNYVLSETFLADDRFAGALPAGWESEGFTLEKTQSGSAYDVFSAKASASAVSPASAVRRFDAVSGKFYFQTFILLPVKKDGVSVALTAGEEPVFEFGTRGGKLCLGDTELYDYLDNVWYLLSLDADTLTGKADIKINGKHKATVDFDAGYFDGVTVRFAPESEGELWFDDVELYSLVEHADYPSTPKVAESKDYNIGINVCYLWRDSNSGEGWDATSAFPEFDTYLGFYDEGSRETADWETKWMAEHGIDFMHICWYPPYNNLKAPIKKMARSYEPLHDGYMNAKYSDLVDFCIMWENGGNGVENLEDFKEYIWKYWREYYFSDPRYARLDNKAVLSVWNRDTLLKSFGSAEGVKQAMDFMDEELKKMGYDGLLLLFATLSDAHGADYYKQISSFGGDASYGYHWGINGYSADYQINGIQKLRRAAEGISHSIPTVSVGFNELGRHDVRHPFITADEHLKVCRFIKDELAAYNTGTWKDNTLFISTWNEFSEGTYVFPTASTGFELLENIRLTFTDTADDDHALTDVLPTERQKARVSRMYPPHHAPIRRYQLEKNETEDDISDLAVIASYDMSDGGQNAWKMQFGIRDYTDGGGSISGYGVGVDYAICSNGNFVPFNAETTPILHIKLKPSVKANGEIFFITDTDSNWGNDKKISYPLQNPGEFSDYYVDLTACGKYKGNVTAIRVDPMTAEGSFEIALIEFLGYTEEMLASEPQISVNGTTLNLTFPAQITEDGDYEVAGEARPNGFYSQLRLYYEWDRFTGDGVLTLYSYNEKNAVFTVGSDKVCVDGVEKPLGYTFRLRDGLPVFRMKKLCDLFGYPYTENGHTLSVKAATDSEYEMLTEMAAHPNTWEFNTDSDQGWTTQNCSDAVVENGFFRLTGTNNDPAVLRTVNFDAKAYNTVTVGVKVNETMKAEEVEAPILFFTTAKDSAYTREKRMVGEYDFAGMKDGVVQAHFYLAANPLYTDVITGLRFDPYNRPDAFEIDYIRCENRDRQLTAAEKEQLASLLSDEGYETDEAYSYEFKNTSELGDWTLHQVSAVIEGGFMKVTPNAGSTDPFTIHAIDADAGNYRRLAVGIRYNATMTADGVETPLVFFTTEADDVWNAQKRFVGTTVIPEGTKEGDLVRMVFDLTANEAFTGKLKQIRFDPYNKDTPYEIDYIRLLR